MHIIIAAYPLRPLMIVTPTCICTGFVYYLLAQKSPDLYIQVSEPLASAIKWSEMGFLCCMRLPMSTTDRVLIDNTYQSHLLLLCTVSVVHSSSQ